MSREKAKIFIEANKLFFRKIDFCFLEKLKLGFQKFSWSLEKLAIRIEELQAQSNSKDFPLEPPENKNLSPDFVVPFFDFLALSVLTEALKINVSLPFAEWDSQARSINRLWCQKLQELEGSLTSSLSAEEKQRFFDLNQFLKKLFSEFN